MKKLTVFTATLLLCGCDLLNIEDDEKQKIQELHRKYVSAWLSNDRVGVMSLFMEGARIQPSSLCPIDSLGDIEKFWFPNDGSVTEILKFDTETMSLTINDTIGIATHQTFLEWGYRKDTTDMLVEQKGISTTIYRRSSSGDWKVWRQMWSDVYSKRLR